MAKKPDKIRKQFILARRNEWHKKAEKWHEYHEKQLEKAEKSGIIKTSRNIASRYLPNGLRPSRDHILSDEEILSLRKDIRSIGADEKVFRFNEGIRIRASYFAAKTCPNLSLVERRYLILDALERAKEQGVTIKHNE